MLKFKGPLQNNLNSTTLLVERYDPMLKNKHEKHKFSKNCNPKTSLIKSKNGNYLSIDFYFH